jgi:death-on-curing protein
MIFFIEESLALKIHRRQVSCFGGLAGVRDKALLQSALGSAKQTWSYTQDLYETAAQYCYSIANNHPILDGNKRTAAACMLVFLVKNGIQPTMSNDVLYDLIIDVATNSIKRSELAFRLRSYSRRIESGATR